MAQLIYYKPAYTQKLKYPSVQILFGPDIIFALQHF